MQTHESACSTIVLNLRENRTAYKLYINYPYFIETFRWLQGKIPFEGIPQFETEENFKRHALPDIRIGLMRLGLMRISQGGLKPLQSDISIVNLPTDLFSHRILLNSYFKSILRAVSYYHAKQTTPTPLFVHPRKDSDSLGLNVYTFPEMDNFKC